MSNGVDRKYGRFIYSITLFRMGPQYTPVRGRITLSVSRSQALFLVNAHVVHIEVFFGLRALDLLWFSTKRTALESPEEIVQAPVWQTISAFWRTPIDLMVTAPHVLSLLTHLS